MDILAAVTEADLQAAPVHIVGTALLVVAAIIMWRVDKADLRRERERQTRHLQ